MSSLGDTPSPAKAKLDCHAQVREKIERANLAVYEAVRAMVESNDPLAANLLGADEAALNAIGNTLKSKLLAIFQTGVPIWSLRLDTPEAARLLLDKGWGTDELFALLLKSFKDQVPLSSI